jgi:hypothetical protein
MTSDGETTNIKVVGYHKPGYPNWDHKNHDLLSKNKGMIRAKTQSQATTKNTNGPAEKHLNKTELSLRQKQSYRDSTKLG